LLRTVACTAHTQGIHDLRIDPHHVPKQAVIGRRLSRINTWDIVNAQNAFLTPKDWFEHLGKKRFPATDYIRKPGELEFTPLPDLFHEYFGHIPVLTNPSIVAIIELFAQAFALAPKKRREDVSRLWWHTFEFGLLREHGDIRVLGAGLLSSPGELKHSLDPKRHRQFDIRTVMKTPASPHTFHTQYFVLPSLKHLQQELCALIRSWEKAVV
jgi:phenylalanine-4-hydroxylase